MGLFSRFTAKSKDKTEIENTKPESTVAILETEVVETAEVVAPKASWFQRLKSGLSKTRKALGGGLSRVILGRKTIDEELIEEIETILLTADIGVEATQDIIDSLTDQLERKTLKDPEALLQSLRHELTNLLTPAQKPLIIDDSQQPTVILMVGVNGAGKTTTIGKLAKRYKSEGKSVMLAAGDTFRAAAVEQLKAWGDRNEIEVIAQQTGSDSASVIFDAVNAAKARGIDVLIADTAGRLQNKSNLMNELTKVVRVMKKLDENAPHETMLVIDAGNGQNALSQAVEFNKAVGLTGLTVTKLDGTAKGGIVFAIAKKLNIPIRFIGVGESIDDLRPFVAEDFVGALFED